MTNALFIGIQSEYAIMHLDDPSTTFLDFCSWLFCGYYFVEIVLKLKVYRQYFFVNHDWKWHWLDVFLVITSTYDQISQLLSPASKGSGAAVFRLLRLFKMAKMLRIIRVMKFFKELRLLLTPIMGSMRQLTWSLIMLALIIYIFACIFLQALSGVLLDDVITQSVTSRERIQIFENWGRGLS